MKTSAYDMNAVQIKLLYGIVIVFEFFTKQRLFSMKLILNLLKMVPLREKNWCSASFVFFSFLSSISLLTRKLLLCCALISIQTSFIYKNKKKLL